MALAACGGEEQKVDRDTDSTGPTIGRTVADRLATRSDKIAGLLDDGDACAAQREAELLRNDLTQAINNRAIPELYLEDLSGTVNEIQAQIPPCEPMQPPPRRGDDDEKKDKKRDRDEGDD